MKYFTDIVGNDALRSRIAHDILEKNFAHAHIIEGPKGSGRHTLAVNMFAALCCEHKAERLPCLICPSCHKILSGGTPDIVSISIEKGKASIGVDDARGMRDDAMTVPNDFPYKMYIIGDADRMTVQAQNALLKTLEEPNPYCVFVLICESAQPLLETIRSRAVLHRTEQISEKMISEYIKKKERGASDLERKDPEAYGIILKMAEGCIGKALSLLNPKKTKESVRLFSLAKKFVYAYAEGARASDKVAAMNEFSASVRKDTTAELVAVETALRDLIAVKKTKNAPLRFFFDRKEALDAAKRYTDAGLVSLAERVGDAVNAINANGNIKVILTNLTFGNANPANSESQIQEQISELISEQISE